MTADAAGDTAARIEELKQLAALNEPLIEFVAASTGVPPEIVFKVLLGVGEAVRRSAGQAAAAVMLDKPAEQVTVAEARAAILEIAVRRDADRTWRAARAMLSETVFLLEPVIFPEKLAGLVMESNRRLDIGDGERAGVFTPAKVGRGRPSRLTSMADERLMIEVVYTRTLKDISLDEAVTIVTGVRRADSATTGRQLPEPTLLRHGDHKVLCRVVANLEKAKPDIANQACKAAEAQLSGAPDANFDEFRRGFLAVAQATAKGRRRRG